MTKVLYLCIIYIYNRNISSPAQLRRYAPVGFLGGMGGALLIGNGLSIEGDFSVLE